MGNTEGGGGFGGQGVGFGGGFGGTILDKNFGKIDPAKFA